VPRGTQTDADLGPYVDLVDVRTAPRGMFHGRVLVRPDGYVAAVGTAANMAAIRGYLQDLTEKLAVTCPDIVRGEYPVSAGATIPASGKA
jgi:hypothetical protein